jgi:hypothetical protein
MMMVAGGDANYVNVRISQKLAMVHIAFELVLLGHFLHPRPIRIAGGDELHGFVGLGLEPMDRIKVSVAPAAAADETDTKALIGSGCTRRRSARNGNCRRGAESVDELSAAKAF